MLLAGLTKTEELKLDAAEATLLANAVANVAKHYDFLENVLSDKAAAWLGLGQAIGMIYGPRVVALKVKGKKAVAKTEAQPDNIAAFPHMIDGTPAQ